MATADKTKIFSGPRCIMHIFKGSGDTAIEALTTGFTGSESVDVVPIVTTGNFHVAEHVPVGYSVSFSFSQIFFFGGELKQLGIFPTTDSDPVAHLRTTITIPNLTILLLDTIDGSVFCRLDQAQITGHSWSFSGRDIVAEDVGVVGIRMYDRVDSPP